MNIVKRIIRWFMRKLRPNAGLDDAMEFEDTLHFTLRDASTGKVVRKWFERHNSWTLTGRNNIRNALTDGGFTKISFMLCNGTGGSEVATTNTKPADYIAQFLSTWGSGSGITGITTFTLRQTTGGTAMSTVTVTSFDKPAGISLEVTWQTTLNTSG